MHYKPLILLAYSSLALATPYHHNGKWEEHARKPCPSFASSLGALSTAAANSSSAALPVFMEPTATGAATMPSSPAEAGIIPSAVSSAAPVAGTRLGLEKGVTNGGGGGERRSAAELPSLPSSSSAAAPVSRATSPATGSGGDLVATFTQYGAGDTFGSSNCNTDTAACAFYSNPGFNAATSQNLFSVGPGAGKGPTCGKCYKLTGQTNPYNGDSALAESNSIIVKVNNLCPIAGNPMCNQTALTGADGTTNQFGAAVNFDLCKDDGAAAALFAGNPSNVGTAKGTAVEVDCKEWSGTDVAKRWLGM